MGIKQRGQCGPVLRSQVRNAVLDLLSPMMSRYCPFSSSHSVVILDRKLGHIVLGAAVADDIGQSVSLLLFCPTLY